MTVELTRKDLKIMAKGLQANYKIFNDPLVKKAGHSYSDSAGKTWWDTLDSLSDEELWQLFVLCRDSW